MKRVRPHILVSCVLAIVLLTGTNRALHNALTDMRFGWFPRQASGDIVLIAIDSPSIDKIGVWPWPRQKHAELIGVSQLGDRASATRDVCRRSLNLKVEGVERCAGNERRREDAVEVALVDAATPVHGTDTARHNWAAGQD